MIKNEVGFLFITKTSQSQLAPQQPNPRKSGNDSIKAVPISSRDLNFSLTLLFPEGGHFSLHRLLCLAEGLVPRILLQE